MAAVSLLNDRCTICTRHKQWAQCSGVRNPASYLKRSELATPKSFDQDFNFLTGIERGVERADRDATSRGVQIHGPGPAQRRDGPAKGETNLQQAFQRCGVTIQKAPSGMSRSLQNKTSWAKKPRCISWTIEWITDDKKSEISNSLESQTVSEAYDKHIQRLHPPAKRQKLDKGDSVGTHEGLGVRTAETPSEPTMSAVLDTLTPPNESPSNTPKSAAMIETSSPGTLTGEIPVAPGQSDEPVPDPADHSEAVQPAAETPSNVSKSTPTASPSTAGATITDLHPPITTGTPAQHFYLHLPHPRASSAKRILVPLDASWTISQILGNRIVREFPTIYVLQHEIEEQTSAEFGIEREVKRELTAEITRLVDGDDATEETQKVEGNDGGPEQGYGKDEAGLAPDRRGGATIPRPDQIPGAEHSGVNTGSDELRWIMQDSIQQSVVR